MAAKDPAAVPDMLSRERSAEAAIYLRVTQIYRREDGEWRLVHRHGDFAPTDQSPR